MKVEENNNILPGSSEPQEASPYLLRGTAAGTPARRPQARPWHQGADRPAARAGPALVAGLRLRCIHGRPALPDPGHGRRLHARMLVPGGGHLAVGHPRGP